MDYSTIVQQFSVPYRYKVFFTENVFAPHNPVLAQAISDLSGRPRRALFVIDSGVAEKHPDLSQRITTWCWHYSHQVELTGQPAVLQGGEACKNDLAFVDMLTHAVNYFGIDRHSYIVAIGGGAFIDMVGYAAAVSHRGIRLIRIPTTVLSQNDSAVGVKNSMNLYGKKNFIGTFAPPYAVVNDFTFLHTLDDRNWSGGMSEAVKVALLKDPGFFSFLEQKAPALAARDIEPMRWLIRRCAELHLQHISGGDPFEQGSSRPLDYGHWAAHKLEHLSDYEVLHGEAVAIGMAVDAAYAMMAGYLPQADFDRIIKLMRDLGFVLSHPLLVRSEGRYPDIVAGLKEFREHLGGELTITLLRGIGDPFEVHAIDTDLMASALQFVAALP